MQNLYNVFNERIFMVRGECAGLNFNGWMDGWMDGWMVFLHSVCILISKQ